MTFRVEVEGTVQDAPTYVGTSSGPITSSPSATSGSSAAGVATAAAPTEPAADEGVGWPLWLGLGLVAVLGALGAAYTFIRARLRGNRTE